jgi:hypothetical protein
MSEEQRSRHSSQQRSCSVEQRNRSGADLLREISLALRYAALAVADATKKRIVQQAICWWP